jgi:ArsR family transcriptional regulator, arsenate/arsenite/antimonite-responsive transcriptional repressor
VPHVRVLLHRRAPSRLTGIHHFQYYGNVETENAVVALEALAQGSRLAIFRLLVSAGKEGRPAGKIAEEIGLPNATLSFHLAQLKNAGLIKCERQSRSLIYSADFGAMTALLSFITENCCQGKVAQCIPVSTICRPTKTRRVK